MIAAPRRGRPLAVWGGSLLLIAGWLVLRWPGLARTEAQLAGRIAARMAALAAAAPALARRPAPVHPAAGPALSPLPRPPVQHRPAPYQVAMEPAPAAPPVPAPVPDPPAPALPDPPALAPAPAAAPAPALAPPAPGAPAFALADAAYARLRAGQRRQAAALFDAALALEPGQRQWQADRNRLGRRWQLGGFALLRDSPVLAINAPGSGLSSAAASPVLGGGQLGAGIAFLPDPHARRPLALVARAAMATSASGVRTETAQLALGLRQALLPGVTLSAERLVALGRAGQGAWTLRLAGGGEAGRLAGYGEAGALGNGTLYAGAQASARLFRLGPARLAAGSWASVQTAGRAPDVWRVDVGPTLLAEFRGVRLQADWRQRVGGNAAPGSGPVVTVSAGF